jgi:hypothetical protein
MTYSYIGAFLMLLLPYNNAHISADVILGKWISAEKNLIVEVYKENNGST